VAQTIETTKSIDLDSFPWDSLTDEQIIELKERAAREAKERTNKFMDTVKLNNYTASVEKAITRLLQIYRLFYEGDETGKGAPEEKKEWLIKQCDRLSSASIAEEAKGVEKVNRLRQGGGGRPRRQPKETDA